MKPAGLYLRVSKPSQRILGVSPEAQEAKGRAWAAVYGYDIGARVFKDLGISGGKIKNRPDLKRALAWACENKGTLIFYSNSRLVRSVHEALHIEERVRRAGAGLASVTELFDTSTANGWMCWMFTLVVDEGFLRQTGERTRSSLQYLKSNGHRVGTVPFGMMADLSRPETYPEPHRKAGQTHYPHLIENPAEQTTLAQVRQWHAAGLRPGAIRAKLHELDLRPRNGSEWWQLTQIYRLLNGRK